MTFSVAHNEHLSANKSYSTQPSILLFYLKTHLLSWTKLSGEHEVHIATLAVVEYVLHLSINSFA